MRFFLIAVVMLFAGAANAATVTFTFDDPATETYSTYNNHPLYGSYVVIQKAGFNVLAVNYDGQGAYGFTFADFEHTSEFPVSLRRADGGAFALHSFDGLGVSYLSYRLADGSYGQVSNPADIGSGIWLNVTEVEFYPGGMAYDAVTIDNIVVSAVPVPAAVWLFVSALGLLGLRRRVRV